MWLFHFSTNWTGERRHSFSDFLCVKLSRNSLWSITYHHRTSSKYTTHKPIIRSKKLLRIYRGRRVEGWSIRMFLIKGFSFPANTQGILHLQRLFEISHLTCNQCSGKTVLRVVRNVFRFLQYFLPLPDVQARS